MKSFIAALRTLVLPFGATTGRRIVLDGVNGRIQIFNAANALVMEIDDTGIDAYAAGILVAQMDSAGIDVLSGGVNRVVLDSANGRIQVLNASSQLTAQIDATGLRVYENGVERIFLDSQTFAGIEISSANAGEVAPAGMLAVASGAAGNRTGDFNFGGVDLGNAGFTTTFIDKENVATSPLYKIGTTQYSGTAQPIIDLTGDFFAPFPTKVVADDYVTGENGGSGTPPDTYMSVGRGIRLEVPWRFEKTTDTALSTTNGTYTAIITTGNLTLKTGRLYRVCGKPGAYLLTAGSGFAAGDGWRWRIHRSVAGGAFASMRVMKTLRSNLAVAALIPLPDTFGLIALAAEATVNFRMEAAKIAGAATVTSSISVEGAEGASELTVEDVGEFTASTALH